MTYTIVDYLTKRETDFRSLENAQRALQRIAADYRRFGAQVRELVAAGYITVGGVLITIIAHHEDTLDRLLCVDALCPATEHAAHKIDGDYCTDLFCIADNHRAHE